MPVPGSFGLPFLIRRPDTGKFTYQRDLGAALAPFVEGEVTLEWKAKAARLNAGRAAIKISLSTGDEIMARTRWAHVHMQVEALIALGQIALNTEAEGKKSRTQADHLSSDVVAAIAGQAEHDLLAADDRAWIDPTFTTPLAGVVVKLLRDHAAGMSERQRADAARRFANDLLERQARDSLREREPGWLDRPISVGEVDADLFDVEGLRTGRVTRTTPEQLEALDRVEVSSVLSSEIDARLAENGLALPAGHPDRRKWALALLRTEVTGLEKIKKRDGGEAIGTPPRPAVRVPDPAPETVTMGPTLTAMRERWLKNKRPQKKQADDNALYIGYFISVFDDLPVTEIDGQKIDEYLMLLDRCCRNVPHHIRKATLKERVAWSEEPENIRKPRLKLGTINAKGLGAIGAALSEAERLGIIERNPCAGMALDTSKDAVVERKPYEMQDLCRIYASSIYAHPAEIPKGGRGSRPSKVAAHADAGKRMMQRAHHQHADTQAVGLATSRRPMSSRQKIADPSRLIGYERRE